MNVPPGLRTACFVTGKPGCGKTTLVRQVVRACGLTSGGFYTEEVREGGVRRGFRVVTLDGASAVLAEVGLASPFRVGKYGVDVEALERVGVASIYRALECAAVVVIDEIGKMELLSGGFREAVITALGSSRKVLATITMAPHPFADQVRNWPGTHILTLTRENREEIAKAVFGWLGR